MRLLLLALSLSLAACQALPPLPRWQTEEGREAAEFGRIVDLHSGESLTPRQLLRRLAKAPRLLVGERHDNPDHHALELWLLQALESRRPQGSLLLEMLEPDQQPLIVAVREQRPADAQLPAALAWRDGWDWSLYGPLLRHALAQSYPLFAANLGRDELMKVYRQPPTLAGPRASAPVVREALLGQIRESHCGKLPESQLPAMLAVQQQRDRRMAEELLRAPQPALLVAGAFHVRQDLGAPLHLQDAGGARPVVLMLAEVGETLSQAQADYAWFTGFPERGDPCAAFEP